MHIYIMIKMLSCSRVHIYSYNQSHVALVVLDKCLVTAIRIAFLWLAMQLVLKQSML